MSNGKGRAAAESPLQADWQPREASPESLPSSHRSGGRPFAEWVPDFPFMAERVDDASKTPAMFVMHSGCFDRTGLDGGCDQRFGCVDDEECPAGCASDFIWAEAFQGGIGSSNPERCVADGELNDDVVTVADMVEHVCSEGSLVELDRRSRLFDPKLRLKVRHPSRVGDGSNVGGPVRQDGCRSNCSMM